MSYDLNNIDDFKNICSNGSICPHEPIEMRNITKDKIIRKPFLDHSIQLCNVNNTDLLSLLTGINDKINDNMINMGENVPSFKNKINGIIEEWYYELTYEDLFKNNRMNNISFNYDDIIDTNNSVLSLNRDMHDLKEMIKHDSGNIYDKISELDEKCDDCDSKINNCSDNLDVVVDNYETKYPQILMDLSTKQKPFYFQQNEEELDVLSNERDYKKIPDKINQIIMNLLLISNMILKESSYLKKVLYKLKQNVQDNKSSLHKIKQDIPEQESPLKFENISNFLNLLMNTNEDNKSPKSEHLKDMNKEKLKKSLQEIDSNKTVLDDLSSNSLTDDEENNDEDSVKDSDEESDRDSDEESDEEVMDEKIYLSGGGKKEIIV